MTRGKWDSSSIHLFCKYTFNSKRFSINTIINVSKNNVYIENFKGQFDIFLSKSYDGGNTFSQLLNLSNTTNSNSINPRLAATANEVYVVWQEDISGNNQTYFTTVDSS